MAARAPRAAKWRATPSSVMNSRRLTPIMSPSGLNPSCSAMLPHAEAAAEAPALNCSDRVASFLRDLRCPLLHLRFCLLAARAVEPGSPASRPGAGAS